MEVLEKSLLLSYVEAKRTCVNRTVALIYEKMVSFKLVYCTEGEIADLPNVLAVLMSYPRRVRPLAYINAPFEDAKKSQLSRESEIPILKLLYYSIALYTHVFEIRNPCKNISTKYTIHLWLSAFATV